MCRLGSSAAQTKSPPDQCAHSRAQQCSIWWTYYDSCHRCRLGRILRLSYLGGTLPSGQSPARLFGRDYASQAGRPYGLASNARPSDNLKTDCGRKCLSLGALGLKRVVRRFAVGAPAGMGTDNRMAVWACIVQ